MAEASSGARYAIVARDLRKNFGDVKAVDGIDLTVSEGVCFGILGPNGAGKTTALRMIQGLSPRDGGSLGVFGLDPEISGGGVRELIGSVSQDDNLDPDLSVLQNLLVYARYFRISKTAARERASELLEFFSLTAKSGTLVPKLSGGMKRRLVIARALMHRPRLVILDEPTTGLDPQARHAVWQRLRQLKVQGITLVLTTHYLDEAEQLCDWLVIMDHGKLLAEGAPLDLIRTHIGSEVVEVRKYTQILEPIAARLAALAVAREVAGDIWLFHGEGLPAVLDILKDAHEAEFLHRRATLEDVFLRLTGRDLRE